MIETERLTLRELRPEDCSEAYVSWLNDPEVSQYLETRHSEQTMESVRGFVEAVSACPNEHLFGIFLKDGRHIGNIKIGPVSAYHKMGDMSLLIGAKDQWGKGLATEAISALSRHAFERLGVEKISASMYRPNLGSKNAFLMSGYEEEGVRREHYRLDDGNRHDLIELGLLPGDLGIS